MKTEIYLGVEKTRDGNDIDAVDANARLRTIKQAAAKRFGGYSLFMGSGGWVTPEGELVEEMCAKLEIVSDAPVREFAVWAARVLDQSCAMVVESGARYWQGVLNVDESVEFFDARNREQELAAAS